MNRRLAQLLSNLVAVGAASLAGCQAGPGVFAPNSTPPGIVQSAPPTLQVAEGVPTSDVWSSSPTSAPAAAAGAAPANAVAAAPVAALPFDAAAAPAAAPPSAAAPTAAAPAPTPAAPGPIVRGQSPPPASYGGAPTYRAPSYTAPSAAPAAGNYGAPVGTGPAPAVTNYQPPVGAAPVDPGLGVNPPNAGWDNIPVPPSMQNPPANYADIVAEQQETQTGRFQFGVGVNSDAGVTGQIVIDERNFDITRLPSSWDEVINGTAWRGAGQGFRFEAMPGNRVQRYLVNFTEPYLFGFSPISLNVSAFYFTRNYFDWNEERLGGRLALGYRLSPDLSVSAALRAENVDISDPRVLGVPQLDAVVGSNDLFTARFTLTHDTRDIPFFPTEGHYIELSYEQAFGEFDYPRGEIDYRKYMLIRERPDGSGRHTLALGARLGVSGTDTPLFENYFAGGFSTLRGFAFRGASPIQGGVTVGGPLRLLTSIEYFFPLTADDMIKGVVFCDAGTVEPTLAFQSDTFRVAPGFGLRLNIPALGPAPLALDFAFPVAKADTDNTQTFSFFFGFAR